MNWLTVVWSMTFAVCGTLAAIHVALWLGLRRTEPGHLWFALAASAAGLSAMAELAMMRATTVPAYAVAARVSIAAAAALLIALSWFVRTYFHNGRQALAVAITVTWSLVAVLCALLPFSPAFAEVQGLRLVPTLWGETFAVAVATTSRWSIALTLGDLLFAAFFFDAAVELGRLGRKRRAAAFYAIVALVFAAMIHARLVDAGRLRTPYVVSFVFLGVVFLAGYPLSAEIVRSVELARRLAAGEAELRASQQNLSLAAEAGSLTIWSFDALRDELSIGEAARMRCGLDTGESVSLRRFLDFAHPEDRPALERYVEQWLAVGGEIEREFRLLLPGGELLWIAVRGAGESGGPLRGVALDVTQRKIAAIEADKQREEIARLGRLGVLSHLATSVAHELNQPLTAILHNAHVAARLIERDPIEREELRQILGEIQEDDKRAADVIWRLNGLLGRRSPGREPIDLTSVVEDALTILRTDLAKRRVQLQTRLAQELPPVHADRAQMQQLLLNLIMSGCEPLKDAPPGQRLLEVRTEAIDSVRVRFSIIDRGPDLDAPTRSFEPYDSVRADARFGLTLSRAVVESHGGRIWVAPYLDRGTVLQFELPIETPKTN